MSIIFRSSMIGDLMSQAKSIDQSLVTDSVKAIQSKAKAKRTDEENKILDDLLWNTLPDGAITVLDRMISQKLLNWNDFESDFATMEKGKVCEEESIELYNEVKDTFHVKNVDRITKGNLTGECDLLDKSNSLVIDIKTAYSKKTFPLMLKISKLYEWQLRAYMHLYDVNEAELAYCLVNTPADLIIRNEPHHWHNVEDVPINLRVSTLRIDRDAEKENQMLNRIKLCTKYIEDNLR